jgi:hypothetical protein
MIISRNEKVIALIPTLIIAQTVIYGITIT